MIVAMPELMYNGVRQKSEEVYLSSKKFKGRPLWNLQKL